MSGRTIGTADSPCAPPVRFGLAKGRRVPGARDLAPAVVSGRTIGTADSPCAPPVRFGLAKGRRVRSVDAAQGAVGSDGDLGACAAAAGPGDGRPRDRLQAGRLGFPRVRTSTAGDADPRGLPRGFVAAEGDVGEERYRAFTTGGGVRGAGVEHSFTGEPPSRWVRGLRLVGSHVEVSCIRRDGAG
ncbi:lipoprotein [Streptomyces sp. MB22_4]|uniref:lipoprotein n=1 Tax=Streptomyces sp. MB22_4 TaxID=3383120 RepID=UPI0039A28430